jgi:hypothetical protein
MGNANTVPGKPTLVDIGDKNHITFFDSNIQKLFTTKKIKQSSTHVVNSNTILCLKKGELDGTIYLLDVETRKWSERIDPVIGMVTKVTPFNNLILFVSWNKIVLWNCETRNVVKEYHDFTFATEVVQIDDVSFAVFESHTKMIEIYNINTGKIKELSILDISTANTMYIPIQVSGNILCASQHHLFVVVYDLTTNKRLLTEQGDINNVFMKDNRLIYSKCTQDVNDIIIYSIEPFQHITTINNKPWHWHHVHDSVIVIKGESSNLYVHSLIADTYIEIPNSADSYVTSVTQIKQSEYYIGATRDVTTALGFLVPRAACYVYNKDRGTVKVLSDKDDYSLVQLEEIKTTRRDNIMFEPLLKRSDFSDVVIECRK